MKESDLIDKTLSTFPPACAILAQQYRNMKFTQHSKLMSYLFLAEKQQQMLLKNAEARPAKEVHTMNMKEVRQSNSVSTSQNKTGEQKQETHASEAPRRKFKTSWHPKRKWNPSNIKQRYNPKSEKPESSTQSSIKKGSCHKCGRTGHYIKECRASQYIVDMYKELKSLREGKRETHTLDVPSLSL